MKRDRTKQFKDTWKLGVIVYLLLFNYPLLDVFNRTSQVFGIPLLIFFLFALWMLFIVLVSLLVSRLRQRERDASDRDADKEKR